MASPRFPVQTREIDWGILVLAHEQGPGYEVAYRFGDREFVVYDGNDPLYEVTPE